MLSDAITTILCDIDGVVRHWESTEPIERAHGVEIGVLTRAAFAPDLLDAAVTGACTDEEWRTRIAGRLGESIDADIAQRMVDAWSEPAGTLDADVVAWIDAVRASGRRVYLATNATSRLDADLTRIGLIDHVDGIVNSSVVRAAKPDHAFYAAALELTGAAPEQCLFVDDRSENVDAAVAAGMTGIHFTGSASLPR